jgi:hypothetical protein
MAAAPFYVGEVLKDYKASADAELHAEFANFLAGDNRQFLSQAQGHAEYRSCAIYEALGVGTPLW